MPLGFIFFDMDETLGFFRNYDGSMNSEGFPNGIYLRRYIKDILEKLNKEFLLFITTAATFNYTKAVLEHADLAKYFHGIFTRNDFVKLENATDANKEASPGGYEKRYGRLMKNFGIKIDDAVHGLVLGDNDYDISSDVPALRTLIVDSLFIPADILNTVIRDIFANKSLDYSDSGLKIIKKIQRHPIANLESNIFEIECPEHLLSVELQKIDITLSEEEKLDMKAQPDEIKVAENLSKKDMDNENEILHDNDIETNDIPEESGFSQTLSKEEHGNKSSP